jgi:hypothetical protein
MINKRESGVDESCGTSDNIEKEEESFPEIWTKLGLFNK